MKKVNPNKTYNLTFVKGRPSTLVKGRVINNCIEKAWSDLYVGVDTATIDPVEAEEKMQVETLKHIYRYVQAHL